MNKKVKKRLSKIFGLLSSHYTVYGFYYLPFLLVFMYFAEGRGQYYGTPYPISAHPVYFGQL